MKTYPPLPAPLPPRCVGRGRFGLGALPRAALGAGARPRSLALGYWLLAPSGRQFAPTESAEHL